MSDSDTAIGVLEEEETTKYIKMWDSVKEFRIEIRGCRESSHIK
jgi:hypothetical protein